MFISGHSVYFCMCLLACETVVEPEQRGSYKRPRESVTSCAGGSQHRAWHAE